VRAPTQGPLSERERQVLAYAALGHPNKLIAYELGIANSTVSVLLARAQTKLGAASRNEMLALYNAASAGSPPDKEQEQ
jgi:DNA-binding CsgD family transcriptional regulator